MDVAVAAKELMVYNRRKFLISGALLGVYVNVLHTVPFMAASEIFLVLGLIGFSAVLFPVVAVVWGLQEQKTRQKICLFLRGMTTSSLVFVVIYAIEVLVGNYTYKLFASPILFPISRAPHVSLLMSLTIMGLFALAGTILKLKQK